MSPKTTDEILESLEIAVGEKLQVMTYKAVCREYGVRANTAKQLLFEFAEKHRSRVSAVYCLSGLTKGAASKEVVRLVAAGSLASSREELAVVHGIHVFSVQPRIPKDPAEITESDKSAAEESMQSLLSGTGGGGWLADNRFSHVKAPFVSRSAAAPAGDPSSHGAAGAAAAAAAVEAEKPRRPQTGPPAAATVKAEPAQGNPQAEAKDAPKAAAKPADAPAAGGAKRRSPKGKSAKGSLGALWNRVPPKKEGPSGSDPALAEAAAPVPPAASKDEESEDEEEEEDPIQVLNAANRSRRRCIVEDDDDEEEEEVGEEHGSGAGARHGVGGAGKGHGPPGTADAAEAAGAAPSGEDSDPDADAAEANKENTAEAPAKQKGKKRGPPKGRSGGKGPSGRAKRGNPATESGAPGDSDVEEPSKPRTKRAKSSAGGDAADGCGTGEDPDRAKPSALASAFAKQGDAQPAKASSRPQKLVERTYFDDQGREVTELVPEDGEAVAVDQEAPKDPPRGDSSGGKAEPKRGSPAKPKPGPKKPSGAVRSPSHLPLPSD